MKKFIGFIFVIGLITLGSCSDEQDNIEVIEVIEPTVVSMEHQDLSSSSVTLSANIANDGGSAVNKCGFLLSETNPGKPSTDWGTNYSCENGASEFNKKIEGLKENTTYYYVAYASNIKGYGFSSVSSFTTPKKDYSGDGKIPVKLTKLTLNSMEYSADGFENSDGAKYKYKMSFTVEVEVCDYESISRAGFMIGGAIWHWDNPSENKINSCSMITLGDSPTLSVTVTAYARMKDGSDYEGNVETLSATYGNNNNENPGSGSNENTIKTNRAEYTYAWTEYKNFDGVFSSYETMKSHLNRYGLLIYKNGNSYYWEDFNNIKHTVYPNRDYKKVVYDYYSYMGNKYNGYKTQTAYLYMNFRFSPF
ncbi:MULTISPECIES: hypothetical protein [Proteiniphilum]|jgi:hypothetical protein|uniref:hypothetical protein n=1 Tax=Proteiniphilum TaxID=294702 RepID=UPI001EEA3F5F|nr:MULTISPECIES: hypothetical protein [Proteiniphilum]MDD4778777.1 hypothetical protein [Fermentimonas sp.]ULB33632.1 hypothetical protein KDN43_11510 [Proteiniphilum propionicum]